MIKDWKKKFQNASNLYRFSFDKAEENLNREGIKNLKIQLNQEMYSNLRNFCLENDYPIFYVLFTAWTIFFSRYTGQNECVTGVYIPQIKGLEHDVVPVLSHFEFNESFISIFSKNIEFFKTTKYEFVAISEIFETLNIDPNSKHHPIYQIEFSFYDNNESNVPPSPNPLDTAPIDLDLRIYYSEDCCTLNIYYSSDILNSSIINNFIKIFKKLLESILETPNKEISSLDILPSDDEHKILIDWNDTTQEYPRDRTITQLFEEQVEKTPMTVAVVYEEQRMTYRELNEKSNQLAHYLRSLGVGPKTLVAIACERSLEMLIGVLGILKAGAAYVPLDPSSPPDRLHYMLEDTKAFILLTQSWLKDKFRETDITVIEMNHVDAFLKEFPGGNLENIAGIDNLAYVIYTSGSTGKPKGVMIEHHNLLNIIMNFQSILGIHSQSNWLSITSLSFDIAGLEFYLPLISGATIILTKKENLQNAEQLTHIIQKYNISFMQATPSVWKILQTHKWKGKKEFKGLCGGEAMPISIHRFLGTISGEYFNVYGPTETTIWSTIWKLNKNNIVIGNPIANTKTYILDNDLRPVPIGVIGELFIGGEGVARGYLNCPELTAEKFISNPFMTEEDRTQNRHSRLYRTGDLCRYHMDGNIEYIGRIDQQVKIRGFRIELGEIESTLLTHPSIQESIVLVRENEPDNKQLVAYYVVMPGITVEQSSLRNYLMSTLPDYMIPSLFIQLEAIPLTSNGKLDRKALLIREGGEIRQEYMASRTPTEEVLVEIWQEILELDQVGVNDNFFEMGGDSLKSFRVLTRIKERNKIEVPYRTFFENPTIAELSYYINNHSTEKNLLPIVPVSRDQTLLVSFDQLPLLLEHVYVGNLIYVIRLEGYLYYSAFEESFNEIIQRHEALKSAVILKNNNRELTTQKIEPKLHVKINIIDITTYSKAEKQTKINNFIDSDVKKPFDLSNAPLHRCHLIKKNENEHLFILTIHHIFFDLESLGILFKELSTLYNAKVLGTQPQLSPLPIQWADFSLWQWKYLEGQKLEDHLVYWKDNLKEAPPELKLPIDYPRSFKSVHDITSGLKKLHLLSKYTQHFLKWEVISRKLLMPIFEGSQYFFEIPTPLSKKLKKLAAKENVTLYMTLLSAFNVLIYGYNSQEDLIIGTPFSNRNRIETEKLIGYFVNFIPLRTNLRGNPTFSQVLKHVKNVTLNAYDHHYVPWVQLLDYFIKQEDPILLNVGRLMFSLEKNLVNNLSLEGVITNREAYDNSYCECELILVIREDGDNLSGCLKYRTNLFKKETIEQMSQKFVSLLESIVNKPEMNIEQLSAIGF